MEKIFVKSIDEAESVYSKVDDVWYHNGEKMDPQPLKITAEGIGEEYMIDKKETNEKSQKYKELKKEDDLLRVANVCGDFLIKECCENTLKEINKYSAQKLNESKLINSGIYPSDQIESIYPSPKMNNKINEKEYSVIELYDHIQSAIRELFVNKNEEYGSLFTKFNRPLMRNEIKRKWERYETLFKDTDNTTEMIGNSQSIIPTMVDLANYSIMTIINELMSSKLNETEIYRIKNSIVGGTPNINLEKKGDL